ncbi:MAG: 2-C-methyl-D-erythritol 4-phosphate cytidylyltransferase [Desulfovibrio sp.]|jgi:2-C-methyl-D-erythritol 4-phosphate cytidylyltransferase/2-C-methyl-D-erythritol 2,4-cyclodiphosphate synthase|nr:2-C-methyl-D-erythritol 4-phosphate cytidylyltransferase [Desulfovibrio sp.]
MSSHLLNTKPWALIMAAGGGSRLASATGGECKQMLLWRGIPLYLHSALAMSRSAVIGGLIFVFPETRVRQEEQRLRQLRNGLGLPWLATTGGGRRQDSVRRGLAALPPHTRRVLVHDAARPFVRPALIRRVCEALEGNTAVIPALPVTDTIKTVANNLVCVTLPRGGLVAAQTPQGFETGLLSQAHERARERGLDVTDDASLMEEEGHSVRVIAGEPKNVKITYPEDLALLAEEPARRPCTGMGHDVHRYGPGRPLILGGVRIPNGPEVEAHSDGDVLLHALMDALLGCAGLGDIGLHFPDSEARFENISSSALLSEVLQMTRRSGVFPTHADVTIVAQRPRISPWREEIHNNVARLLSLPGECVNIKAGTEEGMGFIGRGEGIKVYVVVSALA